MDMKNSAVLISLMKLFEIRILLYMAMDGKSFQFLEFCYCFFSMQVVLKNQMCDILKLLHKSFAARQKACIFVSWTYYLLST